MNNAILPNLIKTRQEWALSQNSKTKFPSAILIIGFVSAFLFYLYSYGMADFLNLIPNFFN